MIAAASVPMIPAALVAFACLAAVVNLFFFNGVVMIVHPLTSAEIPANPPALALWGFVLTEAGPLPRLGFLGWVCACPGSCASAVRWNLRWSTRIDVCAARRATVVVALIEVPVMLMLVRFCLDTQCCFVQSQA